jgi:hypothetical protein
VVENAGKAIQDLCTRIDRILEAFRDTKVDLSENKDSTRDVAVLSANTSPTTIALEVSAEAGPTNHVDSAKLGMGTTIECSMKGKNQLVDDDGKDMANDERTELIEVDTKFTSVNLCFRDPWLALNAIPSRILIGCLSHDLGVNSLSLVPSTLEVPYHCFVLGSVCRVSSPPVPLWRVAVPLYSDQVYSGSRPSPWPDPWLHSGSGSVVVFQPLQPWPPPLQAKSKGSIVERQLELWHDPQIKQDNKGVVVNLLQPRLSPDKWNESWFSCDNAWELAQSHCKFLLTEHMALIAQYEKNRFEQDLSLCMVSKRASWNLWNLLTEGSISLMEAKAQLFRRMHWVGSKTMDQFVWNLCMPNMEKSPWPPPPHKIRTDLLWLNSHEVSSLQFNAEFWRLLARINLFDCHSGQEDMQLFQAGAKQYSPLVVRMALADHLQAPWDPGGSNLVTLLHVRKDRQQPPPRPLQIVFPIGLSGVKVWLLFALTLVQFLGSVTTYNAKFWRFSPDSVSIQGSKESNFRVAYLMCRSSDRQLASSNIALNIQTSSSCHVLHKCRQVLNSCQAPSSFQLKLTASCLLGKHSLRRKGIGSVPTDKRTHLQVLLHQLMYKKSYQMYETRAQVLKLTRPWNLGILLLNNSLMAIYSRSCCIDLGTSRFLRREECHVSGRLHGLLEKWAWPSSHTEGASNQEV